MTEHDILVTCALRFDGHRYCVDHDFDYDAAMETFRRSGNWSHLSDTEKLATFFMWQRVLFKWGGERLPRDGITWRGFRELFLETVDLPIPEEYRMREYYEEWQTRYAPRRDECVAIVRAVHERTEYANDDLFDATPSAW